jgi:hypothetical protein
VGFFTNEVRQINNSSWNVTQPLRGTNAVNYQTTGARNRSDKTTSKEDECRRTTIRCGDGQCVAVFRIQVVAVGESPRKAETSITISRTCRDNLAIRVGDSD